GPRGPQGACGLSRFQPGRTGEATAVYRRGAELAPASRSLSGRLVQALARDGYWKEADAACRRALRLHPDDPYPPSWLANPLHQHGRDEDAVAMHHNAIGSARDCVS